jgi:hypothetical protein
LRNEFETLQALMKYDILMMIFFSSMQLGIGAPKKAGAHKECLPFLLTRREVARRSESSLSRRRVWVHSSVMKFPYGTPRGRQLNRWKDLTKNGTTKVVPFFAL